MRSRTTTLRVTLLGLSMAALLAGCGGLGGPHGGAREQLRDEFYTCEAVDKKGKCTKWKARTEPAGKGGSKKPAPKSN